MAQALEEIPDLGISAKDISAAAIVLVIIGAVIMLIAGIGCCGAAKNSKCLLGVVGRRESFVLNYQFIMLFINTI